MPLLSFVFYQLHEYFFVLQERIEKILKAGANVILTTGGIDDLCLKYFVEAGAMAVRRCKKSDLKVGVNHYHDSITEEISITEIPPTFVHFMLHLSRYRMYDYFIFTSRWCGKWFCVVLA